MTASPLGPWARPGWCTYELAVRPAGRHQRTLAGRRNAGHPGCLPLVTLRDVIQPFPTFSEVYVAGLKALRNAIMAERRPTGWAMTDHLRVSA
jgi:hypothetical protein